MRTTKVRERVLNAVREERVHQIEQYGSNDDLPLGFGSSVSAYPWLLPYSDAASDKIEAAFRADYEIHEKETGRTTWMHLIREEVAELFDAPDASSAIAEAVQVAALCVSLCEHMINYGGEHVWND